MNLRRRILLATASVLAILLTGFLLTAAWLLRSQSRTGEEQICTQKVLRAVFSL